jgi:hypothetical protein
MGGMALDHIEQAILEHQRKGGFDHLPGKGKPIDPKYFEGDVFTNILKNNQALLPWIELKNLIREDINKLITCIELKKIKEEELPNKVFEINRLINKYNSIVPNVILQKRRITLETLKERYQDWL